MAFAQLFTFFGFDTQGGGGTQQQAWQADGSVWTPERAHRIYKQILAEFEAPEMNGAHLEELQRFVARRKQEGGAPTDF